VLNLQSKKVQKLRIEKNSNIPDPLDFHSATKYKNKMIIFGGAQSTGKTNETYIYFLPNYNSNSNIQTDFVLF